MGWTITIGRVAGTEVKVHLTFFILVAFWAMAGYQQARDARVMGIYEFTTQLATGEPPPPEMQAVLGAVAGSQAAMDAFASVIAGTLAPEQFFAPEHLGPIMAAAGSPH